MMKKTRNRKCMKIRLMLFSAVAFTALVSSCSSAAVPYEDEGVFRMAINLSPEERSVVTRSVLPETAAFENEINEVSFAVYDSASGDLLYCGQFDGNSFDVELKKGGRYNFYILANMGNQLNAFTGKEAEMRTFRYKMPEFSSLAELGLPMSAVIKNIPYANALSLELRRLVAKLIIRIDSEDINGKGGWEKNFSTSKVGLYRAAKVLYPFASGGSAVGSVSELYSGCVEYDVPLDGDAPVTEQLVLYVPENCQGVKLPGNDDAMDKSETNVELKGEELCSYISVKAEKIGENDGVNGDFTYRFFPGRDATGDFNLTGGNRYDIRLKLSWDGMYITGNWKVEKSSWNDTRQIQISAVEDAGFGSDALVKIAPGVQRMPFYVYYSPHSYSYESQSYGGRPHHKLQGWSFTADGRTFHSHKSVFTADFGELGWVEDGGYYSTQYISVNGSTPIGTKGELYFTTNDGRKTARLTYEVEKALIVLEENGFRHSFYEYGPAASHSVQVNTELSTVPLSQIVVSKENEGDPIILDLGEFKRTGVVSYYWDTVNTGADRTARIVFSCLVASSVFVAVQEKMPGLELDDEWIENGGGEIEY